MPLRWVTSMVVGVERMLAVLAALSVRMMELMVNEKLTSWSEGASVMRTGTEMAGVEMLVAAGELELPEHPAMRLAASARPAANPRRRVGGVLLTFMVGLLDGRCGCVRSA
jgi:hypothetical protein